MTRVFLYNKKLSSVNDRVGFFRVGSLSDIVSRHYVYPIIPIRVFQIQSLPPETVTNRFMIANFFWFFSLEVFALSCANRASALSFGSWGQVFAAIGGDGLALRSAIREKFRLCIF